MGPRLGSRGKRHETDLTDRLASSFNGAATWKSRKAGVPEGWELVSIRLQWGRDLEVAESQS